MALIKRTRSGQLLKPVDNAPTGLHLATKAVEPKPDAHLNGIATLQKSEIVMYSDLELILRLAERGFNLFPLSSGSKSPMMGFNWTQKATSDQTQLKTWFSDYPNCNWGTATGVQSGVLVLDVDGSDGRESLNSILNEEDSDVPNTLTVLTGTPDSFHFWFAYSGDEAVVRNSAGRLGRGLDIRADGGYVVVPPSIHENGKQYTFTDDSLAMLPTPRWLLDRMAQSSSVNNERYRAAAPRTIPEGERNDTLFRDACALRRRGATEEELLAYVREVNKGRCEQPVPDQELRRIAHSAAAYPPARLGATSTPVPTLDAAAMYGLAGKVVGRLLPHTEADGPALLLHLLAAYGNMIGRKAYCFADSSKHYANLFYACVGETAKGRKGTSWNRIREILERVDYNWARDHIQSGLSSGEGLVTAAAHAGVAQLETDSSTAEKLLFIVQSEFASTLKVMTREGNTLSAVIRDAWDKGFFQIMVKKNPLKVDNAHITIVGHITREELKRNLTLNESGNGFANRFLWARSRRSKCLPEGGHLGDGEITELATLMTSAVQFGRNAGLMQRDPEAKELWASVYPELSEGQLGLFGEVTSRAEAQVLRLSMIYALLDSSPEIRRLHLEAALALWSYCEQTAHWIFGGESGDPLADEIFAALRSTVEMTQNDIMNHFHRHQSSAAIKKSLALLRMEGKVRHECRRTKGRQARVWKAVEVEEPATSLEDDRERILLEDDDDPRDNK